MGNKIIDDILLAEKQSEQIISKAKQDAIKALTQAEEKSLSVKTSAQEKFKEDLNNFVIECEEECKVNYKENLATYVKTAEELERRAEENIEKAVKVIVDKIV